MGTSRYVIQTERNFGMIYLHSKPEQVQTSGAMQPEETQIVLLAFECSLLVYLAQHGPADFTKGMDLLHILVEISANTTNDGLFTIGADAKYEFAIAGDWNAGDAAELKTVVFSIIQGDVLSAF
jgi:hypothetical protein